MLRTIEANLARARPDQVRMLWDLILELQPTVSDKYLERALADAPGNSRLVARQFKLVRRLDR